MNISNSNISAGNNPNFGMPWVVPACKIRNKQAALSAIEKFTKVCEFDEVAELEPVHRFSKGIIENLFDLPKAKQVHTMNRIRNAHEKYPHHAMFYEKGLLKDKLYAVPMTNTAREICSTSDNELLGATIVPVSKSGDDFHEKIHYFLDIVGKQTQKIADSTRYAK